MNEENLVYPVCINTLKNSYFLLWKQGEKGKDSIVLTADRKKFVACNSFAELAIAAKDKGFVLATNDVVCYDINRALKTLANLREGQACSTKTSHRILDFWNIVDDLAWSALGIDDKELTEVYQKFFSGNNLPSVTPEGYEYWPLFNKEEIASVRKLLRGLWKQVVDSQGWS